MTFCIVESGIFLTAPASFISAGDWNEYILDFLRSPIATYFILHNGDKTGAGDVMLNIQSLIRFSVPQDEMLSSRLKSAKTNSEKNHLVLAAYSFTKQEIQFIESQCIR